ncbi:MAG TPA: ribonuclease P protein component [Polyangiaceae bacterium]|nr:ribonuclease P protein component [Polyangiaceae bacterium]HPY21043.1 ribonuclease P protein component [Polyangiaceae bacterium]HQK18350.1 ribonuclease P protein component [Polyangiaceae bacterium]
MIAEDHRSLRLTRDRRLRHRRDFVRIQSTGVRVTTEHFVFLMAPRTAPAPSRLGITVTKKVGCAVVRNRAKRLIRETFRTLSERLPRDVDVVVIVRKALHGQTTNSVMREWLAVEALLHRRAAMGRST